MNSRAVYMLSVGSWCVVLCLGYALFGHSSAKSSEISDNRQISTLPVVGVNMVKAKIAKKKKAEARKNKQPDEINHPVAFTAQAPHKNWNLPYKEACEEASMIMAKNFLLGNTQFSPERADKEILDLVAYQEKNGYAIDINAEQTRDIINDYYKDLLVAQVRDNPTVQDIKSEVAAGNIVIMPFAGRQLKNSHFRYPGPPYHMLVVRGYDKRYFYTNDPGTQFGENFKYTHKNIMSANHDWNNGNVNTGKKVMVVVSKK